MKPIVYFFFILFIVLRWNLHAQIDRLKNLPPDELKRKASQMGYTEEDFIKYQQVQQQTTSVKPSIDTIGMTQERVVTPPSPKPGSEFRVAAFVGRDSAADLPAYGYNIFTYAPTTFEPSVNIPAPKSYTIGPGDEIVVSLWGETQMVHRLTVSRDGTVYIPDVGLVNVNGLSLNGLRNRLSERLSKVYSSMDVNVKDGGSTKLDVSTGKLRSVKVYVLGEINKPGGYTLPALSSAFTALYYSGGPTINGTLRSVKIIRGGKTVSEIDIYNYLTKGDKSEDINLEDGDIVFVPIANKRIALTGSVFRPAIYELKEKEKLCDLLKYSGGLTFNTYFQRVHVERVIPFEQRMSYVENLLSLDISFKSANELKCSEYELEDGDVVTMLSVNNRPENRVTITGNVRKPGTYELTNHGMTIKDLVLRADSLFPDTFTEEALLIRTLPNEKKEITSFNLWKAMEEKADENHLLQNRDEVRIFNIENFYPVHNVEISGEVKNPGSYTRYQNMRLTDLIVLAGGVTDMAFTKNIEVARLDTTQSDIYYHTMTVSLPNNYWNISDNNNFVLQDYDRVLVKTDTAKNFEDKVIVSGEVQFPGAYTIQKRGEKLLEFISRAGGFKQTAYKEGIYVGRNNALFAGSERFLIPDSAKKNMFDKPVYDKASFAELSKRIPITWNDIVEDNNSIYNLVLQPGDTIVVPKDPCVVFVMGEVGIPSSVPYVEGAGLSYYIRNAGGYSTTAAEGDELVVLPNGKKWSRSGWFFIPDSPILSGSTIFVPTMVESESNTWPIIRDVVTVISTAAVLVLTVKSLSDNN